MRVWPSLLFVSALSIAYIALFIVPNHVDGLALIPSKVHSGEIWRFLTYPFVHFDMSHLLKNLVGLALVTGAITQLKSKFSDFSSVYLLAGFLAVLPLWFIFQFTALGASVAIYSVFGLIAIESKKYEMRPWHILLLILVLILAEAFVSNAPTSTMSALSHLSGLIFGVFAFNFALKTHKVFEKKKGFCLRKI